MTPLDATLDRFPKGPTDAARRAIAATIREEGPARIERLVGRYVPRLVRAFVRVDLAARAACAYLADWIDPDTADPSDELVAAS